MVFHFNSLRPLGTDAAVFQQQSPQALSVALRPLLPETAVSGPCLAGAEGIEPPTSGFGDQRSAN